MIMDNVRMIYLTMVNVKITT